MERISYAPKATAASRRKVRRVLKQIREKYNITKAATMADFYRICEGEGIVLMNPARYSDSWKPCSLMMKMEGFCLYHRADKVTLIFLRTFWEGRVRPMVAFHELGHALLKHLTNTTRELQLSYHAGGAIYDERESEADLFSELIRKEVSA